MALLAIHISSPLFSYSSSGRVLPSSIIKSPILASTSHGYVQPSNTLAAIVSLRSNNSFIVILLFTISPFHRRFYYKIMSVSQGLNSYRLTQNVVSDLLPTHWELSSHPYRLQYAWIITDYLYAILSKLNAEIYIYDLTAKKLYYSTVTDLARFLGLSTSFPLSTDV